MKIHLSGVLLLMASVWITSLLPSAEAAGPYVVSLVLVDGDMRTDWPDRGVVAFRRPNSTGALTVNFTIGGTAVRNTDYTVAPGNTLVIPDGDREAWLEFSPNFQPLSVPLKKISVTLTPGNGYTVATTPNQQNTTINLANTSPLPSQKAAVRFLVQAAFGPNGDLRNVQEVTTKGYDKWLTDQFAKPVGLHQATATYLGQTRKMGSAGRVAAWWGRAMNNAASADVLRQRVAFALSEIFVISDRVDELGNEPGGMANFYDLLVKGAFGNYRDLLYKVGTHPCMGIYLSHLQNEKGDPEQGTFADENYAREVMQLFTIGLWELNQDGTRKLDPHSQPIPTYDNGTIAEMARVMTGFSFGGPKAKDFWSADPNYLVPMRMWDEYHDMGPKTLLNGVTLPARVASDPDKGTAGLADYTGAIDCLFLHPNTPPFVCKQLIQRLITSNPTPGYVSRVAAKFINNGSGLRGDLKAVIRAILLDPEARDPRVANDAVSGKMKEPYLRTINLARAFNSKALNGSFLVGNLDDIHFQEPMSAPSVFNFFKPAYSPTGPISDAALVAPEFQILNAVTALSVPNYFRDALEYGFNRWGGTTRESVRPQFTTELTLVNDVPALLRRLDLILTGGTLSKEQHQVIREAVEKIDSSFWHWREERVRLAVYLIATGPEFGVIK
jgi:uncharacterized protein (DUF1800 family)